MGTRGRPKVLLGAGEGDDAGVSCSLATHARLRRRERWRCRGLLAHLWGVRADADGAFAAVMAIGTADGIRCTASRIGLAVPLSAARAWRFLLRARRRIGRISPSCSLTAAASAGATGGMRLRRLQGCVTSRGRADAPRGRKLGAASELARPLYPGRVVVVGAPSLCFGAGGLVRGGRSIVAVCTASSGG